MRLSGLISITESPKSGIFREGNSCKTLGIVHLCGLAHGLLYFPTQRGYERISMQFPRSLRVQLPSGCNLLTYHALSLVEHPGTTNHYTIIRNHTQSTDQIALRSPERGDCYTAREARLGQKSQAMNSAVLMYFKTGIACTASRTSTVDPPRCRIASFCSHLHKP